MRVYEKGMMMLIKNNYYITYYKPMNNHHDEPINYTAVNGQTAGDNYFSLQLAIGYLIFGPTVIFLFL